LAAERAAGALAPRVSLTGVRKSFGAVRVLDDVSLVVAPGEVVALVGENGAGKSTLIKVLTGFHRADTAVLEVDGRPATVTSARDAEALGIRVVHQDRHLAGRLSVAEQLYLGRDEAGRSGLVNRRELVRRAERDLADSVGLHVRGDALVDDLTVAEQQLLQVARAVLTRPRVLVLDEPTASLAAAEAALLFDAVRRLAADGVAVVYISHYLREVGDLADRVLVLRNGRTAGEVALRPGGVDSGVGGGRVVGAERDALLGRVVELMVGHQVAGLGEREQRRPDGEPLLSVDGLTVPGAFAGLSLRVLPGEVVGVTGLIGSGVEALADAVTTGGATRGAAGRVGLGGRRVRSRRSFVRAGGAHVPAQRRRDGIVVRATVRENIGLVATGEVSRWGLLLPRRERAVAERWVEQTDVRPADPEALTGSLSGGNQQKVVLAKWLARGSRLFVLDQPTAGVDIASREQLYARIEEQVDRGAGVLLITTDLEELVGLADRVLVLHRGEQVAELPRAELGVERLLAISSGQLLSDRRDQQQGVPA